MTLSVQGPAVLGECVVRTTEHRGHTIEEVAEIAMEKVMHISEKAPSVIRDQAEAFKKELESVLVTYMKMAVEQDRATLCAKIREAGHPELAAHLRRV